MRHLASPLNYITTGFQQNSLAGLDTLLCAPEMEHCSHSRTGCQPRGLVDVGCGDAAQGLGSPHLEGQETILTQRCGILP